MMVIQDLAKTGDDLTFKMAVMPIYGKKHSNDFFSRTTGLIGLIFCMSIWDTSLYKNAKSGSAGS